MYQAMPFNNQYYRQPFQVQPQMQPQPQPQDIQPLYRQPMGLQGKSVDNIEVVKATDIPLDGSISYFPLADGSAIVTKQLQQDGTSKTIVYKPVEEKEIKKQVDFVTSEQLDETIKKMNNKDDIKTMKRQIEDLIEDVKEINKKIK